MAKIKSFYSKHGFAILVGLMGGTAAWTHNVVLGMLTCTLIVSYVIVASSRPSVNVHIVHEGEAPEKLEPKEEK